MEPGTWQAGASSAISGCRHWFSIKNSTRHLVALIESAVKEWMKCNQGRRMLLFLQGTGSRCLEGRTGCSVLLSTVQGSCWTTNHCSLGGFPGRILLCAYPVHFHTQQLLAAMEAGIPGNLGHGSDWIPTVVFYVLSSLCGRDKRFCYLLWLASSVAGDNLSCCLVPAIPSVHLSSFSTAPGLYLNPSFFLHEVNQTKLRGLLAPSAFLSTDFKNFSSRTSLCVMLWQCLPPLSLLYEPL